MMVLTKNSLFPSLLNVSLLLSLFTTLSVTHIADALPSACPSDSSIIGYSNWFLLMKDVEQTNIDGKGGKFVICPGSYFDLGDMDDPNYIDESYIWISGNRTIQDNTTSTNINVTIQCGPDEYDDIPRDELDFMDNSTTCVISGGMNHFTIEDDAYVHFKRLIMKNALKGSVSASSYVYALFEDCVWSDNRNYEDSCRRGCTSALYGLASSLTLVGCRFLGNSAPFGTIHALYGILDVDKSMFVRNRSRRLAGSYPTGTENETVTQSTGSAITAYGLQYTKISNSCFLENYSDGAGTVKVVEPGIDEYLDVGENNYFQDNSVAESLVINVDGETQNVTSCTDILKQSDDGDWTLNECIGFTGISCSIDTCGYADDVWAFDCGEYSDPCREYDLSSCEECTAIPGCMWCGSDSVCSSTSFDMSFFANFDETSTCTAEDYVSQCEVSPDNVFNDPLYDAQKWVYDLINVEPVWKTGITGAGVHIRINDEGVDANHPDIAPKFDKEASCQLYLPEADANDHGTVCAAIAGAGGGDNTCSVGIAPDAQLSSCRILSGASGVQTPEYYDDTYISLHLDKMDISSNSWGFVTCNHLLARRRRLDESCPFNPNAEDSPCNLPECTDVDWGSPFPSDDCEISIIRYCFFEYENDVNACIEFLDLFVDCNYNSMTDSEQRELIKGITEGRDGKGVIYIYASGNDFGIGGDTNFQGATNSRFVISVGATGKFGKHSSYSNGGASLFISGPGGDHEFLRNHVVSKPGEGGLCQDAGVGTSFSTPVVSGVVALMLQVNAELGWRDVQGILASTSQKTDPDNASWSTNAAGFHHSYKYGFGLVDAEAAVNKAKSWTNFSPEKPLFAESGAVNIPIADIQSENIASTVTIDVGPFNKFIVESAVVYLDLSHASRGDLEVTLISPSGTVSILHPGKRPENMLLETDERWKLTTVRSWGEDPNGDWTLSVVDARGGDLSTCVDDPSWWFTYKSSITGMDLNVTCLTLTSSICEGGEFLENSLFEDPSELASPEDGSLPTEACCNCGGGFDVSTIPDVLRSWRLVVYSHEPSKKDLQQSIVISLMDVPGRDMDATEVLLFEQSILNFMNNSDMTSVYGISNMNAKVSDQMVAEFLSEIERRNNRFRGLQNTDEGDQIFYNQITIDITGQCHDCDPESLALLFNSTLENDPQGLITALQQSSDASTDYYNNVTGVKVADVVETPLTRQPTAAPTVAPEDSTVNPAAPPSGGTPSTPSPSEPTTPSSSFDIPIWFWIVVVVGAIAVVLLVVLTGSLIRNRKDTSSTLPPPIPVPQHAMALSGPGVTDKQDSHGRTSSSSDGDFDSDEIGEGAPRTTTIINGSNDVNGSTGANLQPPPMILPPPTTKMVSDDDDDSYDDSSPPSSTYIGDVGGGIGNSRKKFASSTSSFTSRRGEDEGLDQPIRNQRRSEPPRPVPVPAPATTYNYNGGGSHYGGGRRGEDNGLAPPPNDVYRPTAAAAATNSNNEGWTCKLCTFRNESNDHLACSVCGAPRSGELVN